MSKSNIGIDLIAGKTTGRAWVVKVGSSLVTADGEGIDDIAIGGWVDQMATLRRRGIEPILVSSGAVAEGMVRLGMREWPDGLHLLQAAAAVGQMGLVQTWESHFQRHGLHTAQVLLTHDDTRSRQRYLNARTTLRTLLALGVVPVVNENDTVVTDEIRFGDNDTLAALVANLVEAEALVILTDQAGLFEHDPRRVADARLVRESRAGDTRLDAMAGGGSRFGRGGMITKVHAARRAARSGAVTIIAAGREADVITRLAAGEALGTRLTPDAPVLGARKQWLVALPASGRVQLDDGAVRSVCNGGRSLLAIGVRGVEGTFTRGELVVCVDGSGCEVARGLVNYGADETRRIAGRPSADFAEILGYAADAELIHRDNLVVS